MASLSDRVPENVEGEFFVDSSCIDCETCMWLAPQVFRESGRGQSFVWRQPADADERRRALLSMIACPTASIGKSGPSDKEAARAFPLEMVPGSGVYYCGYASEDSFGASSWLVVREGGNLLVDSPRAAGPLLKRIEELGGVKTMFLTHRDDVADHDKFAARFGCERVMHAGDARHLPVERRVDGEDPVRIADDLLLIPTPGHTAGSACLLYRDEFLFSGDHLWGNERGFLGASRSVSWYSWPEQKRSLAKLLDYRFRAVLPGHGWPWIGKSADEAREALATLVARL